MQKSKVQNRKKMYKFEFFSLTSIYRRFLCGCFESNNYFVLASESRKIFPGAGPSKPRHARFACNSRQATGLLRLRKFLRSKLLIIPRIHPEESFLETWYA